MPLTAPDPDLIALTRPLIGWTIDAALILGFTLLLGRMDRLMRKPE